MRSSRATRWKRFLSQSRVEWTKAIGVRQSKLAGHAPCRGRGRCYDTRFCGSVPLEQWHTAPLAQLAEQLTLNVNSSKSPRECAQKTRENVTIEKMVKHVILKPKRGKVKHS